VLGLGGRLGGQPRQVTVVAVEPRGTAAESPDAGGSARDGASVSGIGKSRRRWREPTAGVECHAGLRLNHRMREDPLEVVPRWVTAVEGTGGGGGAP
jgi:hypothetical protein